jgi:hypothetical protein
MHKFSSSSTTYRVTEKKVKRKMEKWSKNLVDMRCGEDFFLVHIFGVSTKQKEYRIQQRLYLGKCKNDNVRIYMRDEQ